MEVSKSCYLIIYLIITLSSFSNAVNNRNPVSSGTVINFKDPKVKSHLESLIRIGQNCMLKTKATTQEAFAYFTNTPSETRSGQCFSTCMLEASQIIKHGKVNRDVLIHLTSIINGARSRVVNKLKMVSTMCLDKIKGISDRCKLGATYNDCLNDNMSEFAFPIDIAQEAVHKMTQGHSPRFDGTLDFTLKLQDANKADKGNTWVTYHVEPLNNKNYNTWKIQAEAMLLKDELWGYIDGSIREPDNNDEQAKLKYYDREIVARAELILMISPPLLDIVKNAATAREIWEILQEKFCTGDALKTTLLKKLTSKKQSEHEDVVHHLNVLYNIWKKLSNMSVKVDEELVTLIILHSLNSKFDNFKLFIESQDRIPKPEDLRADIIKLEYDRITDSYDQNTTDTSNFSVTTEIHNNLLKKNFYYLLI